MIHGPFTKFEAMIADASKRATYVEDAFKAVVLKLAFDFMDDETPITAWSVVDGIAVQCGMVISLCPDEFGDRRWAYELTEDHHG